MPQKAGAFARRPPPEEVHLLQHPQTWQEFDRDYGDGAAAEYLPQGWHGANTRTEAALVRERGLPAPSFVSLDEVRRNVPLRQFALTFFLEIRS